MTPMIVGWGHTKFGKHDAMEIEDLIRQAGLAAIESSGFDVSDIDGVFVGTFNGGFVPQDFAGAMVGVAIPELRHVPAARLENACATGSAAIYTALDAIMAGRMKRVLVVGYEKMNTLPTAQIGEVLLKCSYVKEEAGIPAGFAGVFGEIAAAYFEKYGDQSDALATIAAKNHKNGVDNPFAHLQRDLGFEFCRQVSDKNPMVAGPLKRSDCSLVSDGAAAVVISMDRSAQATVPAIQWLSRTQVNEWLPMSRRDPTRFDGAATAWQKGLSDAGLTLGELSFVETHDCFTIAELLEYEAMGLAAVGKGAQVALDGVTAADGRLPVNRSGGLKSKGHPIGATGVSMHVMASMQLAGQAGAMQLPKVNRGAVFNMGGTSVANYLSILQAV
jgi:acetyl-CoA C-acetyltransferase